MGWSAYIETENGEIYRVILPSGITGGKAILSFITIAVSGCDTDTQVHADVSAWIRKFDEGSSFDFCDYVAKLYSVIYAGTTTLGNWEYTEDEYAFFRHRNPGYPITQAEFRQTINKLRETWMDIHELIDVARAFLQEFKKGHLEQTHWYVEKDTIPDFTGLLSTLTLAENRGVERVRIRID